jgi:hypothetical protein
MKDERKLFGEHERAVIYKGLANLEEILQAEVSGELITRLPNVQEESPELLVLGKHSYATDSGRSADQS